MFALGLGMVLKKHKMMRGRMLLSYNLRAASSDLSSIAAQIADQK